ncbi:hypothetical protein ABE094_14045 [Bacillus inaquosorum]|uniref:hypothetical protein n=1 Tax=Bacillus inaquosorum TaxID=483913 RepID=UPI002E1F22A1|nr:hypothetical protein [Bacillus inaquosorum]
MKFLNQHNERWSEAGMMIIMPAFLLSKIVKSSRYIQLKPLFLPAGIDFSVYKTFRKSLFPRLITGSYFSTIRIERRGNQIGFNRKDKQNLD